MKPLVTMRGAMDHPQLLGPALAGDSWLPWRAMMLAIMGEPLLPDELEVFRRLTGRRDAPTTRAEEVALIAGRRGGKTRAMASLAVYIAGLCDHRAELARGERGVVLLIAPDTKQARVALDYADGIFADSPMLRQRVASRNTESISLTNGIDLQVRAASFRRLRGLTAVAVFADEACFWHSDDSANPDTEILNAARPMLATTGGPLIVASSPYARRGEVYATWRRHYGAAGDPGILVARGASRDFNPSLPQSVVDRALERDPAAAKAEYLGQWRDDVETFVSRVAVDKCVEAGALERPPLSGVRYRAFVDPSGGSSDSMTLAISHAENGVAVLDVIRERRAPFAPEDATEEFASVLKRYGVHRIVGDRYGGEWPRDAFRRRGIAYDCAERSKSDLYRDLLPAINSASVDLLDHPRFLAQLCALERRTARGGRDSVDHPPGAHDDVANAAAGALVLALDLKARAGSVTVSAITYSGDPLRPALGVDPSRVTASWSGAGWVRAIAGPHD